VYAAPLAVLALRNTVSLFAPPFALAAIKKARLSPGLQHKNTSLIS